MARPVTLTALKRRVGRAVDGALAPRRRTYAPASSGPTVAGLFRAASGIGESARLCFDALQALGHEPDAIDLSDAFQQGDLPAHDRPGASGANTGPLIIHLNPPELLRSLRVIGRARLAGRRIIGYWAWELPKAPDDWLRAMRHVHEVWTPSEFCTRALSDGASVPVKTVPHILPAPPVAAADIEQRDVDFHVIASGDARSSLTRKNLDGAVRAFSAAFGDDADVRLSIRLSHGSRTDPLIDAFTRQCAAHQNIRVVTAVMDEAAGARFVASADAMLSLHRSEGFGLVLAKSMRAGLPVIATGWSGNMEFMTPDNACLVDHDLIGVADPQGVYPYADQVWAEPDLDAAADWLRRLRAEPALRARVGAAAADLYPAEKFRAMLIDALGAPAP